MTLKDYKKVYTKEDAVGWLASQTDKLVPNEVLKH